MIPVTKPFLPNRKKLDQYIDGIYESRWLTNNGPLVQRLTRELEEYLGVENLLLVSNGTMALQIAYHALGISDQTNGSFTEAVTSPFSFIATSSSLIWEGIQPIFSDINRDTWCLDPVGVSEVITPYTKCIVPVHVFGNACDVEAFDYISETKGLKVIYDASHAFGVNYKGRSLLNNGDASTLSFHATKLFHTGEGGAIIFKRKEDLERAKKMINFGITGPESIEELGINAKMNEFQAAIGLCMLDEMRENLKAREEIWLRYERSLSEFLQLQTLPESLEYNYAYFPVVFKSELQVLKVADKLLKNGILARRYFYPSLDSVKCLNGNVFQSVSNDISSRILCLPIYDSLSLRDQEQIINLITGELG